jgi:two-component system chemotaxis response regulator CheY
VTTIKEIKIPLSPVAAAESLDRLIRLLREHQHAEAVLKLDASRIRELDFERLQLLLSAVVENPSVKIVGMPDQIYSAIESLGLLSQFKGAIEPAGTMPDLPAHSDVIVQQQPEPGEIMKRILTIDDSKTMRDMLMITLVDAGYDVLQAVDGEDGLDVLSREQVDLVITDINMPKMDGYEVIRRVRANPAYQKLPVLVLTTEGEVDKRAIAKEAGATGWMVKPFDPERLIQTVMKVAA